MADAPPPYNRSNSRPAISEKASTLKSVASTSKSSSLLQKSSASRRSSILGLFRKAPEPEVLPDATVKAAVLEDVRTLVQPYAADSIPERLTLLGTCAQLCVRHKLDFSLLLQGKAVESHSALYWAIVNNNEWPPRWPFALVAAVLSYSAPLTPETVREARRACISLRSQEMFHFLRMSPEFGTLSTEDRYLLGVAVPPEDIIVEEIAGDALPFSVRFHIPQFQKRMMLGKDINVEFVARGRLWNLKFYTASKPTAKHLTHGYWSGLLRMVENSPMTPAAFGLVFLDARPSPSSPEPFWVSKSRRKEILYVQGETEPKDYGIISWSWTMFRDDSPCIAPDGSLTGVLGVKLASEDAPKRFPETIPTTPDEQCIIC
ncbi:hypothetical protein C8F04DRAFT_1141999 [Mycena alexandri]|uniref:Uncharacterized protein n=1 Tax=Mycena alexandri TaxID=1745969 RepID=A0AAD6S8D8_9AGAR|nr:hypothetical protein C8F04DRAFT_1141999 [Mycena alexandri]